MIDAVGVVHAPFGAGARIVSLVPSVTELLFDLGLGDNVVGRTHFCVHPAAELERVTSVGGTKKISLRKLAGLDPTHVILNVDENTRAMAAEVAEIVPHVVVTHPIEPVDNVALFRLIGGIFGRAEKAGELSARFNAGLAKLRAAAREWPERRVLYLIWKDPWMTVSRDTYVSHLLGLVGWRTVGHDDATRYPTVDMSGALLADTDLVLFSSEPYAFSEDDIAAFARAHPESTARLLAIDGEMTSWYGSRSILGLDYLRTLAAAAL